MTKIIPAPKPEDALQRLLSIPSLGDAMDVLLDMVLPVHEFAAFNKALLQKHGMWKEDPRKYYQCVRRDNENFSGPEETPCIVCDICLGDIPVDDDDPNAEFVLLDNNPIEMDGLECEVCGN